MSKFFRRNKDQKPDKTEDSEDHTDYDTELDTLGLAQEAVKTGLIDKYVLDHLTSLHPQVPSSMKHRYLLMHLYDAIKSDEKLFARMVQVFVSYHDQSQHPIAQMIISDDYRLDIEHLPDLVEFLVPFSSHWRPIGTALRFKPQDQQYIEACQAATNDFPRECLIQLLGHWVQRKHGHTVAPTANALEKALRSHTVGLGALACELKKHILPRKSSQALPYYRVNANVKLGEAKDDYHITTTYSENMGKIEAEEKGSVLLETQVTSKLTLALEYQWLRDGKPISGATKPILYISDIDLDMDGSIYSCKVTINSRCIYEARSVTLQVSSLLDQYRSSLASMYTAQPEVPQDTWPPVSSKKHINLALIKQEQVNYGAEYARLTIRGDMDDILQHKQKIEYDDIFKSLKSKHVLFIEGRPGCGKTTFVHKITRDWAVSSHGAIRLALLVSLRVLNNLNKPNLDLLDILKLFKDLKVTKELLEERDGKGVCFVFDGLDEFSPPDGKDSMVYTIIRKEYLTQSTVIVASRPAAIAELRGRADKVVEVLGFPNEQIIEYFDHYPFSTSSKSEDLRAYLPSHPNILHMCYLPIHAAMVGFLFEVTGKVPKTESEIYKQFTRFTILRSLSKNKAIADIDVENLTEDEEKLFNQICKLALEKTILNKQVLHQDEVKSYFQVSKKDGNNYLGLITVDRAADLYGFKDIYTFLHLTFQEYLAAHHISTLSDEEQHKLIAEHGDKNHMLVVWKFYCSLIEFSVGNDKFKIILDKTPGKDLFHTQCAYESQQSLPCTQLSRSLVFKNQYLTTSDCTAIGYVMDRFESPTKLSIVKCNLSTEAVDALVLQMKENIHSLHFHLSEFDSTEVELLSILLKKFQKLTLTTKPVRTENTVNIYQHFADILKHCANLKGLDISDNDLGDAGARTLATGLTFCKNLETISIRWNDLTVDGALDIFMSIRQCNLLVNAKDVMVGNKIEYGDIVHVLKNCTNLKSLDIALESPLSGTIEELKRHHQEITTVIAHSIRDYHHEVHTIILGNFDMGGGAAESLAEGLSQCPKLQVVDLSYSRHLAATSLGAIAASLTRCTSLKELHLYGCGIDCQGAIALSRSLKHYQNLLLLSLHSNNIDSLGAKALVDQLHHRCLDIRYNKIGVEEAKAILSSLKSSLV